MTTTGEGHFQKIYQNGKPIATEGFVTEGVQDGTGGIFPTHADLDARLDAADLSVNDANNLGGVAASAYQKIEDTPQMHHATYCLDILVRNGNGNVTTAPTTVPYADVDVVSYTVSSSDLLRSSDPPLSADKSFTLVHNQ